MKRCLVTFGSLLMIVGCWATYTLAGLVPNGDFETGDAKGLAEWRPHHQTKDIQIPDAPAGLPTEGGALAVWDKVSRGAGSRSLKLVVDTRQRESGFGLVCSPALPLTPGSKYQLQFYYRAEGLAAENLDRSQYCGLYIDIFFETPKGRIGAVRKMTNNNSADWARLELDFTVPEKTEWAQVRLTLANKVPQTVASGWFDDVEVVPAEVSLVNPSFETGGETPDGWIPFGQAKCEWAADAAHAGRRAVKVSDAPQGLFSGWSATIPVRPDRKYSLSGYVKGGVLNPDGPLGGGALQVQFLDRQGQTLGEPAVSPAVGAQQDWTSVATPPSQPPAEAVSARLTAGLCFCRGTAWFDELSLVQEEAATAETVFVTRAVPAPSAGLQYAENLLPNGTVEAETAGQPADWTYVGKSDADWTPEELKELYRSGRPKFNIGRGRGEWSRQVAYSGQGALLNVSIDPPLSPNNNWYGRTPVDGFWLSAPMPCRPGQTYLASAWIRPGTEIESPWFGPLELRFYDAAGRQLPPQNNVVRSGLPGAPGGKWTYWATLPWIAPEKAATMRLRFGQEFRADSGGWGRTYGDNFAVWEAPSGVETEGLDALNQFYYSEWFKATHRRIKPPYLAAPARAAAYESAWGRVESMTVGNLFVDPTRPVVLRFKVFNVLGEKRTLSLRVLRTDWLGAAAEPIAAAPREVEGWSGQDFDVELPPAGAYGAFHLEAEVREGEAPVGNFSGRYAVLPPLERPRTAENIWGVTPLGNLFADGRQVERDMGELIRIAGFGVAWVRIHFDYNNRADETIALAKRTCLWYRGLGLRPVLQLMLNWEPPVERERYFQIGQRLAKEFQGVAAAYGNWGIEQANHRTPQAAVFRPWKNGVMMSDEEYDQILAATYDGLKSVDPQTPALVGNIATDVEAATIRRLYGQPAEGRFDGAILNAYAGQLMVCRNTLKEFDKHGDTQKTVWQEEMANQRSPAYGEARRYGEAEGPKNMVRTWLSLAGKLHPRIKSVTMWGFRGNTVADDISMVTVDLQPRPQFVAHVVMADALADAEYVGERSVGDVEIHEWKRGDGPFFALWAGAGEREIAFEAPTGKLTGMDLMGNRTELAAVDGLASVKVTAMPIYLFGGGALAVSHRLELQLGHGATQAGRSTVRLIAKNCQTQPLAGTVTFEGPLTAAAPQPFKLAPGQTAEFSATVAPNLPAGRRSAFRAVCRTEVGASFAVAAGLNFAQAVRTAQPPRLDGTWADWAAAPVVEFGDPDQVRKPDIPGESYTGPNDLQGRLRLLWDEHCLYLGVEARDDVFVSQPERNQHGFMGDSIEFAVQPDNRLEEGVPYWEYELYLPRGQETYAASRRFPLPAGMVDQWKATIKPTGERGNVNYQAAIPWADLGVTAPEVGKTLSMAVVLNDQDDPQSRLSGGRCRIRWFSGLDTGKNPQGFGDLTLVEPAP